jgi:hypothetical protein
MEACTRGARGSMGNGRPKDQDQSGDPGKFAVPANAEDQRSTIAAVSSTERAERAILVPPLPERTLLWAPSHLPTAGRA